MKNLQVVVIESLSFTGTTWVNLVLGNHPETFGLGPADRVRDMRDGSKACFVHPSCPFWKGFFESYDTQRNFFRQISEYSGKRVIITNNPRPDGAGLDLIGEGIRVCRIRLVRDGRAVLASWIRKKGKDSIVEGINSFLAPSMRSQSEAISSEGGKVPVFNYETILAGKTEWLEKVSKIVGVDYGEDALRYWENECHPVSGNQGTVSMIKFAQGIPLPENYGDAEFYRTQYEKAIKNESFEHDRWKTELSEEFRFLFDITCGVSNARLGYERDVFDPEERKRWLSRWKARPDFNEGAIGGAVKSESRFYRRLAVRFPRIWKG